MNQSNKDTNTVSDIDSDTIRDSDEEYEEHDYDEEPDYYDEYEEHDYDEEPDYYDEDEEPDYYDEDEYKEEEKEEEKEEDNLTDRYRFSQMMNFINNAVLTNNVIINIMPSYLNNTEHQENINTEHQENINEEVKTIIMHGLDNIYNVSEDLINFIELCYLKTMEYVENLEDVIKTTIKNCFSRGIMFDTKELTSGIIHYSLCGSNTTFCDNYDSIVIPTLENELKIIVSHSVRLSFIQNITNMINITNMPNMPNMEDVKLVVDSKILETIPKCKYTELQESIKTTNNLCTICQDNFKDDDVVRLLPCEHIYHPECIDDWLKIHSYKCPCCRKPAGEYITKM
jgi:hypothetical protein